ncbi:hypothetical protein PENTCL1PPCAC_18390 [Pristionchus entomophagus]|uniref:N-acetyltransferase domain-containing protein n=1 Tax=Pristionchus entomophagus TaxID=358040 RepID=A0AAV5TP67_9BILA|nr:hypothetical protein PENTCL1PPCAC_18390 [Pristionchus entomophagus]
MAVPEVYAEAVRKLPDLGEILQQQRPWMSGQPFQMQEGSISEAPKGVGNPWKGAYSNHGFWFKLEEGDQRMFDKLVARSNEEEKFLMRYELLDELRAAHRTDVDFLVAANQRGDLIGGVVRGGDTVVVHFVCQEYRHSAIGSILIKELIKRAGGKQFTITLNSSLYRSIDRFGAFTTVAGSTLQHVTVTNPNGLGTIAHPTYRTLTNIDWENISKLLDQGRVSIESAKIWARDGQFTVVGDEKGVVSAVVRVVEAAGGYVKRIVVGPLVADSTVAAEAVLHAALQPMQNDKTDYPWNPDVQSLHRRTLHFRIPKGNKEMMTILRKFAGEGSMEVSRIEYQTFSMDGSNSFDAATIFAAQMAY